MLTLDMNRMVCRYCLLVCAIALVGFSDQMMAQGEVRDTSLSLRLSEAYQGLPFDFSTAAELRQGLRIDNSTDLNATNSVSELRLQINSTAYTSNWSEIVLKLDLGYDGAYSEAITDIRNLFVDIYPQSWWNIKAGRQIITWGKGDLVFINDLFPKDYQSFLLGRDIQYLKAPNNAIKFSLNPSWLQTNIVYVPRFDADRYLTGERVSFFDPLIDGFRGAALPIAVDDEYRYFQEDELHVRLQKNVKGFDFALYFFDGYWKSPRSFDPTAGVFKSDRLTVYGASVDFKLWGGIFASEIGYYDSVDDQGLDPLAPNDELRWLVHYTRDFKHSLSLSVQYYSEVIQDYDAFLITWPANVVLPSTNDFINIRIRKLAHKQRLELSLFSFLSVRNKDYYLRPSMSYKISDYWKISAGANIFGGTEAYTPWAQFSNNTAAHLAIKWTI